jgi:ABC-type Fe3+/spermidine/putrescine transport system ATPase subunit
MSAPALSVRDLRVTRSSRSGTFALEVDALDLEAGGVLAVLGPNGAGKSTLLRCLAGLEPLAGGVLSTRAEGPVTMVFQRPIAFAGSVRHNLRAALLGTGLPRSEIATREAEALERFGIARHASRRASTLSGGELRRLALARAFVLRPGVLLLDEPFEDLDAAGQESLSLDLQRAIRETGIAAALVTHDLRRALLLADRIAVLLDGRLVQCGARDAVLEGPRSLAVARVVGMSNLVPGTIVPGVAEGPHQIEVDALHRIPVALPSAPTGPRFGPGDRVHAGIRPEHLKIDVGRGEGIPIGKARVRSIVSDGAVATVTVEWAGHELRTHLLAGRGIARSLAPGDPVVLEVRPEEVHLVPADASEPTTG